MNILEIFLCVSLFFTTEVYLKWHSSLWSACGYVILLPLIIYVFTGKAKITGDNVFFATLFAILFMWTMDSSQSSMAGYLTKFLIPFIILIPWNIREQYLDFFVTKIFPLFMGLSIFFYVLAFIGIDFLPTAIIKPLNELKPFNYTSHVFYLVPNDFFMAFRFYSYYDEPGVVGTLMGTIVFFYHKKLSVLSLIIYIIAGVLSFSAFFFVAIMMWLFFDSHFKLKHKLYALLGISIIIIVIFSYVDTSFITENIFDKLKFENGKWVGNDRNSAKFSDYFYDQFIYTSDFWNGTSGDVTIAEGSSSFEKLIFFHGFIYFAFGVFIYLLFFFRYKVSPYQFAFNFAFWFGLNYQRPSYDVLFFYLIFTTVIQSQYYNRNEEQSEFKPVKRKQKPNISCHTSSIPPLIYNI